MEVSQQLYHYLKESNDTKNFITQETNKYLQIFFFQKDTFISRNTSFLCIAHINFLFNFFQTTLNNFLCLVESLLFKHLILVNENVYLSSKIHLLSFSKPSKSNHITKHKLLVAKIIIYLYLHIHICTIVYNISRRTLQKYTSSITSIDYHPYI